MKDKFYIISGYFAPIHMGHIDIINSAAKLGKVIVIVNNKKQLINKRGMCFMDEKNRVGILKNIKNVSKVYLSIDKDATVSKTIKKIRKDFPDADLYFANGGDRNKKNVPELQACNEANVKMIYNVGGKKIYSSRNFLLEWTIWAKKLSPNQMKKFNLIYEKQS